MSIVYYYYDNCELDQKSTRKYAESIEALNNRPLSPGPSRFRSIASTCPLMRRIRTSCFFKSFVV